MTRRLRIAPLVALAALLLGAGCSSNMDEGTGTNEARATTNASGRRVLPNWATDEELEVEARSAPPRESRAATAPSAGFRVPAEYEPVSTVIMTWAGHEDVLSGIAAASAAAGADVWMVGGPSSIAQVPASKYRALDYAYNSIWMRDYGPFGIDEATNSLGIIDTTYRHYAVRRDDDAISCKLASTLGASCHTTNLILDGGNYMTDGHGNVFVTKRIYNWNSSLSQAKVNELLKTYLNAQTVHVLDYAADASGNPADGTGHMDMMAKLVGECKVIVAQTNDEPFKTVTDKAANYFANLTCAPGRQYEVTRVRGWMSGRTWYTYSNSLIVNRTVIIPFYDDSARNEEAVRAYQSALPGYNIVGVNSEATIVEGGSIHCITKEIPVAAH